MLYHSCSVDNLTDSLVNCSPLVSRPVSPPSLMRLHAITNSVFLANTPKIVQRYLHLPYRGAKIITKYGMLNKMSKVICV